ncbi:MAG TPA: DUF1016 domain-containing protein [Lentisphaeria bacterium]|nr:MAG: hypothetical protein A2X48_05380 [Lentisphaerae bacterium GWF2_49_21]HBC86130.1 DUF1016 domain-containing protein [Lentisphaeria bacterium]
MKAELLPVKQFDEVVRLIQKAREKTFASVNKELITLYWNVGAYISRKVKSAEWGEKTVDQLAGYINHLYPELKGFDRRGLYRMKQFHETYAGSPIVTPLVTQLSWTNNLVVMSRCKAMEEKLFYLKLSAGEKYSKRELERQINSGVYERTVLAKKKLATVSREMPAEATDVFRDSYVFDFLDIPERHSEHDLRNALIHHLRDFILELGKDFTFVGEEYKLKVGKSDFAVDLLFFHRGLQCLVAIELKIDKFKPEYLGKLEFYLEALDRDVRKVHEKPSIGILICRDKDHEVVEYALSRSLSPTVIAEYESKLISKKLLKKKLHEFLLLEDSVVKENLCSLIQ